MPCASSRRDHHHLLRGSYTPGDVRGGDWGAGGGEVVEEAGVGAAHDIAIRSGRFRSTGDTNH